MKRIRIAIVGSGFGFYGLLPAFSSLNNCIVVAICGRKTKKLLDYCQSIGIDHIYENWQSMLEKESLDAVAIAVTPNAQYIIAKAAIQKKINVFAEKPLAATTAQAKELLDLAKKNAITHAIDFIFPEIDVWQKVKKLLENKALGELKYISVNWSFLSFDIKNKITSWKTDVNQGGGALSFYFSHTLYYLEYYAGEISNIKSKFFFSKDSLGKGEVGVDLLLQFKNGVDANVHLSCNERHIFTHKLVFTCEKGEMVLDNTSGVIDGFTLSIQNGNKKEIIKSHDKIVRNEDERVKIVRKLASKFIDACLEKKPLTPSFKDGLRVQQLIERIREEQTKK